MYIAISNSDNISDREKKKLLIKSFYCPIDRLKKKENYFYTKESTN